MGVKRGWLHTGRARDGAAPCTSMACSHRPRNNSEISSLSPQQEVHHPISHVQSRNVQRILPSRLARIDLGAAPQQGEDHIAAAVVPGSGQMPTTCNALFDVVTAGAA